LPTARFTFRRLNVKSTFVVAAVKHMGFILRSRSVVVEVRCISHAILVGKSQADVPHEVAGLQTRKPPINVKKVDLSQMVIGAP